MNGLTATRTESPLSRLHRVVACVGVAALPIAGGFDTVGLALLTAAAALGIPLLLRTPGGLSWWLAGVWLAWWAMAAASLAWSTAPQDAALQSAWPLVILPALAPLRERPACWLWALGLGVAAQSIIQTALWQFGSGPDGLHWYPPYTGMWAAAGVMLLIGLARTRRSTLPRLAAVVLTAAALAGVLLSSSLACWASLGAGGVILAWRWASTSAYWRSVCWVAVIGLGAGAAITLPHMWQQVRTAGHDLEQASRPIETEGPAALDSGVGLRVAWWHAGWVALQDRPLAGSGAGSVERTLAELEANMPSRWGAAVPGFLTRNPHCSLISTAIEQGGIGVVLLLGAAAGGLVASWRLGGRRRVLCGLTAAWGTLLVSGVTHAVLLEPYTAALASLLLAASLGRPPLPCAAPGD
ncbi:MAG: O-antigen ligase family protein [Phycisphaerales bacterium]|jgi:hypothetical protein|nr:O-antigen ligase family protein [Phycisphaerales bacterium]